MNYVLVSLVGDEATQFNQAFAEHFAAAHPPARFFAAAHPAHAEVQAAVRECGLALVMGHDGGGSLRAASRGAPWATPEEFAALFRGARVWVYACDTRGQTQEDDLDSFGRVALAGGVRVFAGHASPITAPPPFATMPHLRDELYRGLARAFRCFLHGSNSAEEIRRAGLRSRSPRSLALTALGLSDALASLRVRSSL